MAYYDDTDDTDPGLSTSVGQPGRPSFLETVGGIHSPPGMVPTFIFGRGYRSILNGGRYAKHMKNRDKSGRVRQYLMDQMAKSDNQLAKKITQKAQDLGLRDAAGKVMPLGERGTTARIFAGNRLAETEGGLAKGMAKNSVDFITKTNPALSKAMENYAGDLSTKEIGQITAMSSKSLIGGYAGGFVSGVRSGGIEAGTKTVLGDIADNALAQGGAKAALLGAEHGAAYSGYLAEKGGWWAAQKAIFGGESVVGKAAGEVGGEVATEVAEQAAGRAVGGMLADSIGTTIASFVGSQAFDFVPVVGEVYGVVSTAALAGKIGTTVAENMMINPGVKNFEDATASFMGQIRKSPFGMGYRDTALAATSRQRGVAAIQNSRLNMRSALGNEASGLAARYS